MALELTSATTVGDVVAGNPLRAKVFEAHGIDYCCGGKQLLTDACSAKQLDPGTVLQEIDALESSRAARSAEVDWNTQSLTALIQHLLDTHHVYLKEELPRLQQLADKVARVHGDNHPELREVRSVYMQLVGDLMPHLMKEEMILFPLIQQMEQQGANQGFHCGSIGNPIAVMEYEHETAGALLARLRQLTDGYTPPADACGSYQAFYAGLADLEFDTHLHIHKENVLLFPRAQALEAGEEPMPTACGISAPAACQLPGSDPNK